MLTSGTAGVDITLDGVEKHFRSRQGSVHALSSTTLSIDAGQFVSVVGPSGCGKSTLLSLLAGLDAPSSGRIVVGGDEIRGSNPHAGTVFQSDFLLEWRSVVRNVLLPFELRGEPWRPMLDRATELLHRVGVGHFADHRPSQLSGGMRQRVAICRAIIDDPPLLLMDEPFGALDALTREQLNRDLAQLTAATGKTVIFVTHSIEEAVFLGDRVIVMSQRPGRIVEDLQVSIPREHRDWQARDALEPVARRTRMALETGGAFTDVDH